jgi:hypothetical protein
MEIREAQIEDVLVNAPTLTKRILKLDDEPRLLVRQMILPSGRLDMLYTYRSDLLLIELKVVPFQLKFVKQVLGYKTDLLQYQNQKQLIYGEIQSYLLCTSFTESQKNAAHTSGVICAEYNPEEVLQYFYQNLKPIATFVEKKPIDIGIWNIHLIHDFIYLLEQTDSVDNLRTLVGGSARTLYNKIKFANELRLVNWEPHRDKIYLTPFGEEYVKRKDLILTQRLSEGQAELLKDFVMQNPYESSIILGIASIVEAVFALAKNTYPVPMNQLIEYFTAHAGKHFDWQTHKAKYSATRMYSNYAIDLGLMAKSGEAIYLTPEGFRFTIQMQLHKSLKMVESVRML